MTKVVNVRRDPLQRVRGRLIAFPPPSPQSSNPPNGRDRERENSRSDESGSQEVVAMMGKESQEKLEDGEESGLSH